MTTATHRSSERAGTAVSSVGGGNLSADLTMREIAYTNGSRSTPTLVTARQLPVSQETSMSANERKDQSGTDDVRIYLTPEQKAQAATDQGKDVESSQLDVQELEERIAPAIYVGHWD